MHIFNYLKPKNSEKRLVPTDCTPPSLCIPETLSQLSYLQLVIKLWDKSEYKSQLAAG